jgi:hypothetical protein
VAQAFLPVPGVSIFDQAAAGLFLAVLVSMEYGIAPLLFPNEWGRRGLWLAEASMGAAARGSAWAT